MNAQLNYIMARHRSAELQHAGQQARFAREALAARRESPDPHPITSASGQPARGNSRGITALEIEPAIGTER